MALAAGAVELEVNPDVSGFGAELKAKLKPIVASAERDLNKIGPSRAIATRLHNFLESASAGFGQLSRNIKKSGGGMASFGKIINFIKFPAIIAGIDVLAAGVGALVAGTIELVAGLAPLTGVLVLYPAIAGAVGQAFGVVALALSGVSTAVKAAATGTEEYRSALAALAPSQRLFVRQIVAVKEQLSGLKEIASSELLPGLGDSLQRLTQSYMPAVQEIVRSTAAELSILSGRFTDLFTSDAFVLDVTTIARNNVTLLDSVGKAVLGIADGFRHIILEAQPFVLWMGRAFETIGTNFASRMDELRRTGSLAAFFDASRESATTFGAILSNLSHALFNVLQIAQPLGQQMLENFALATQGWQDFTDSIAGRSKIFDFFKSAEPTLHAMTALLRDITAAFFELAQSPGITAVIESLRTQLLPLIVSIGQTASGALLPALVDLAEAFLRLFESFGTETNVLVTFIQTLASISNTILDVLDTIPGLKTFLVTLIALSHVFGVLGGASVIKAILSFQLYGRVTAIAAASTAQLTTAQAASVAMTTRQLVITKVTAAWVFFTSAVTGTIGVLRAMIGLGPAVAISLGSAALGAATLGVALGIAAKIAIDAADKIVTANTKVAEMAGKGLVNTERLFDLSASQFEQLAESQDRAAADLSLLDKIMGQSGAHVTTYAATWEQLTKAYQDGKLGVDAAARGFQILFETTGRGAEATRTELELLTKQMFYQGKITREQLVTRLLQLGLSYSEATGRASEYSAALRGQSAATQGIIEKVRVFTFRTMEQFTEWGNTVKKTFRDFVEGAESFKDAFSLNTRELVKQMRVQVRVARQGAEDMARLGDLAIPPQFKEWLINQGPATIRAFVTGNEAQQGIIRKSWSTSQKFIDRYGKEIDRLPEAVRTKAVFDTDQAMANIQAYRAHLLALDFGTTTVAPSSPRGWNQQAGAAEGGIVMRPTRLWVGEKGPEKIIPLDDIPAGPMRVEIVDSNLDLVMTGIVRDEDDFHSRRGRANR